MAHEIFHDTEKKQHAFFSVKEKPWHGLGVIVDKALTSEEAIKTALLDYTVEKAPVTCVLPDGKSKILPERFVTYRADKNILFDVVGKNYTIVQNKDAFGFFDSIVGSNEAMFETAGSLYSGEVIFITAKLTGYIRVGKDDLIEQYIFLQSTHDGSGSIIAAFSPIRICCANTLNMAMHNCSNKISIRHTRDAVDKLRQAHKIMGISNRLSTELGDLFNRMSKVKITDLRLKQYLEDVVRQPKKESMTSEEYKLSFTKVVDKMMVYAMTHETQQTDTTRGTLFGAMNVVSGYLQNVKSYRSADAKLESIIKGDASRMNQKAFELALVEL